MVQVMFPEGNAIPQGDNARIHTAKIIKKQHEYHSDEVEQLVSPLQSPDLNIHYCYYTCWSTR